MKTEWLIYRFEFQTAVVPTDTLITNHNSYSLNLKVYKNTPHTQFNRC